MTRCKRCTEYWASRRCPVVEDGSSCAYPAAPVTHASWIPTPRRRPAAMIDAPGGQVAAQRAADDDTPAGGDRYTSAQRGQHRRPARPGPAGPTLMAAGGGATSMPYVRLVGGCSAVGRRD